MRAVLALATAALLAGAAPSAHAGCAEDYLDSGGYYVVPQQHTVGVSGGVVTVDTNSAVPDAKAYAGLVVAITTNEAGDVVVFVDCVT